MKKEKMWGWKLVFLAQTAFMAAVSAGFLLISLLAGTEGSGALYGLSEWGLIPVAGFATSLVSTRKGLNPYLAWVSSPVMQVLTHLALTGLPTSSPGMPMLTAFTALIGAAAGDEINRRKKRKRGNSRRDGA